MWRFSIATKQQIEGFPTTVKPYQIKTSKIAPKATSSGDVGRFSMLYLRTIRGRISPSLYARSPLVLRPSGQYVIMYNIS